jgi:hypothetical protein
MYHVVRGCGIGKVVSEGKLEYQCMLANESEVRLYRTQSTKKAFIPIAEIVIQIHISVFLRILYIFFIVPKEKETA